MADKTVVIEALRAALKSNAGDIGLKLHLAELLVQENVDVKEAAALFAQVLAVDPAHVKALQGAAGAYRLLGDTAKADGYDRIWRALGKGPNATVSTVKPATTSPAPSAAAVNAEPPSKITRLRVVDGNAEISEWEDDDAEPVVTLADVGGMEYVKKRLHLSFLAPLKNPDMMQMFGKSLRGGLLLYGPPGCGKTFIARALAGELGAKFLTVGLSDVLDMWLGESERKLHEIFESARHQAPVVLFFDEIDALGLKRSQMRHSAGRTIVNQLLAEMDTVGKDNRNVFMLSATNHPWDVDTALRRPGRFDRSVLVLPPDEPARLAILQMTMRGKPGVDDLDLSEVAKRTDFHSGADLVHLVESALEYALEDSLNSGEVRPITAADFKKALKEVKSSTRPWFDTAKNYAMFANEGGSYDELLEYIQSRRL